MKKYFVEIRQEDTWQRVAEVEPDYSIVERQPWRWLFWHKPRLVIANSQSAESTAAEYATHMARAMGRYGPARVRCSSKLASGATSTILYERQQSRYGRMLARLHLL